jgi:DnaK suppressor protein
MNAHVRNTHSAIPPDARARIEAVLAEAATSRRRQLEDLPDTKVDPTAAAHRGSVVLILAEIEAAQGRLCGGSFGACERCGTAIPVERLELRPWTRLCVRCASR